MDAWQFLVDRGGTFTDIIGVRPDGVMTVNKLLSDNPRHYDDAVIEGIDQILKSTPAFNTSPIEAIKMGTTVATNALLTKSGAKTALLITKGFKDLFRIGTQQRPDLFALSIERNAPLYHSVLEIDERIDAKGHVIEALVSEALKDKIQALKKKGITSIAIALIHSDKNAVHEKILLSLCDEFNYVIASHQVGAIEHILKRGGTTVLDAYLSPVLIHYIQSLKETFKQTPLYFMQSQGGLVEGDYFYGRNSILSGPAGGVVGAVSCAQKSSIEKVIGFDMGGTSTDVFHYQGQFEKNFETEIAGTNIHTPMLDIHTIAAGGGSTLHYSDGRMQVGPESAGSDPGPASYRNGGPLTITDANFLLGKLQADYFPQCFGSSQDKGPSLEQVKSQFESLTKSINKAEQTQFTLEEAAAGFIDIAVEAMSQAIKTITFERGHQINEHTLFSFGGASGQHACLIAERLGLSKVILHPLSSVLSAYGMGVAELATSERVSINRVLNDTILNELVLNCDKLKEKAKDTLLAYHGFSEAIAYDIYLQLKTKGTRTPLLCRYDKDKDRVVSDFKEQHLALFGFFDETKEIEVYTLIVEAKRTPNSLPLLTNKNSQSCTVKTKQVKFYSKGKYHDAPCYESLALKKGDIISGPSLIIYPHTTFVVEPGWDVALDEQACLVATASKKVKPYYGMTELNPILLEIFNKSFMHVATQMGYVLANTAMSVNIKERRDYSCALFDKAGGLIANAPHMPVHLGSMGESVKAIIKQFGNEMSDGDCFILNDPYQGGTHLPDMTVITPVFIDKTLHFFLGARGHHADIGGKTPGSIPAFSNHIEEEGALISPRKLIHKNEFLFDDIERLLKISGARNIPQNLADLKAQCAANQKGVQGVLQLIETYSLDTVLHYTQYIQKNAALAVNEIIAHLNEGHCYYPMDNGAHIDVVIKKDNDTLIIDFTESSLEQPNNFNAPYAITKAAVLYVLRTLVKHDIPLNEGCLDQVRLIVPEESMLNPTYPHAVVSGNVETSQAIVNAIYLALGVMASAQGTMNNLTFGNDEYQYYETLCGGTGAGQNFHGCDAIHSHMTNSLLTDVEVLESRYPVRIEHFSIRKGSGGEGKYQGGNGVRRHITFLSPMSVNMVSGHREIAPPALNKGGAGACGKNYMIDAKGETQGLASCFSINVVVNDGLVIETPGGGGAGE